MEAEEIADTLGLVEAGDAASRTTWEGGTGQARYLLLRAGETPRWRHLVDEDCLWHFYDGSPAEVEVTGDPGSERASLRSVLDALPGSDGGPQVVVRSGAWQRARSLGPWSLVGCTTFKAAPGDPVGSQPGVAREGDTGGGGPRHEGRLEARRVMIASWRTLRRDRWRVLPAATVLFGLSALFDALAHHYLQSVHPLVDVAASMVVTFVDLFVVALFIGLLVGLVGQSEHGHRYRSVKAMLRSLPLGRLMAADFLSILIVAATLFMFVVPGLVVFTFLAVSGPVVELEGLSALRSLRRSAALVRHRFFTVFLLVTVPVFVGDSAVSGAVDAGNALHPALGFALTVVGNIAVQVVSGLFAVEIGYRLIEADREHKAPIDDAPAGGTET